MAGFAGKRHSDESKAKISARAKDSWQRPEVRAKRSRGISQSWAARRAQEQDDAVNELLSDDTKEDPWAST